MQSKPAKLPIQHWKDPAEDWDRIHIDYAGPLKGIFSIVVDAKSKWAEITITFDTPTTEIAIKLLSDMVSGNATIYIMVSGNATIFTSEDFKTYCKKNDVFQKLIVPVHPNTNGLAGRNAIIEAYIKSNVG